MSEPDLNPARDESVRALLAAAKHTEPAPAHVVARLDETLAGLVSERREVRAPVVTLASRRRRTASTVLLAAAAAVVFGVGVTQFVPSIGESGQDSGASSPESLQDQSTTQSEETAGAQSDSPESPGTALDQSQLSTRETAPVPSATDADTGALSSTTGLKPQVRRLRPEAASTSSLSTEDCLVDPVDHEDVVSITYDGRPGALVYQPAVAGRQLVDVYLCGDADPVRSLRLRAR